MNPVVVTYLNRLSDWFFSLARAENAVAGVAEVQWVPKGLRLSAAPGTATEVLLTKKKGPLRGPFRYGGGRSRR